MVSIFSKRIKALREKKKRVDPKWTQGYVSDIIGVARPTYTAYENGTKEPPMDTINKIADLYNVKADYLMGRTDDPTPSKKEEPIVSFLLRSKEEMSPEAWQRYSKLIEDAKKAFMDEVDGKE